MLWSRMRFTLVGYSMVLLSKLPFPTEIPNIRIIYMYFDLENLVVFLILLNVIKYH